MRSLYFFLIFLSVSAFSQSNGDLQTWDHGKYSLKPLGYGMRYDTTAKAWKVDTTTLKGVFSGGGSSFDTSKNWTMTGKWTWSRSGNKPTDFMDIFDSSTTNGGSTMWVNRYDITSSGEIDNALFQTTTASNADPSVGVGGSSYSTNGGGYGIGAYGITFGMNRGIGLYGAAGGSSVPYPTLSSGEYYGLYSDGNAHVQGVLSVTDTTNHSGIVNIVNASKSIFNLSNTARLVVGNLSSGGASANGIESVVDSSNAGIAIGGYANNGKSGGTTWSQGGDFWSTGGSPAQSNGAWGVAKNATKIGVGLVGAAQSNHTNIGVYGGLTTDGPTSDDGISWAGFFEGGTKITGTLVSADTVKFTNLPTSASGLPVGCLYDSLGIIKIKH